MDESLMALLKLLRERLPKQACYGIRLQPGEGEEILVFYHPWGCEEEFTATSETLDGFFAKVEEWQREQGWDADG